MYRQSERNLLSSNISSTRPHNMVNFGPLAAEIVSLVWGTPANFNGFCVLPSVLLRRRSLEANHTLHDVWPYPVLLHYIYIFGGSCPDRILSIAKFTLRPRLAFSYIGTVTAWHSSSGRQPNFAALTEGATYIRQGGNQVGHWPTFLVSDALTCETKRWNNSKTFWNCFGVVSELFQAH